MCIYKYKHLPYFDALRQIKKTICFYSEEIGIGCVSQEVHIIEKPENITLT